MGLLRLAHREVPMGAWSDDRVRKTVDHCLENGAVLLSLSHGTPVATMGLAVDQLWWSADYVLADRWLFVHPEHRRAPHARGLLRTAKDTAKDFGINLMVGLFSSIRTAGKTRLFEREFGAPIGATFLVRA